jgi:hypothetical protein
VSRKRNLILFSGIEAALQAGEAAPCFYSVCPAREPRTVALFVNTCVAEGLSVRVTPLGASTCAPFAYCHEQVGTAPLATARGPPPRFRPPGEKDCILVRGWWTVAAASAGSAAEHAGLSTEHDANGAAAEVGANADADLDADLPNTWAGGQGPRTTALLR